MSPTGDIAFFGGARNVLKRETLLRNKIEGKERTLTLLSHEIRSYEKSNTEIEVIQFQLSSTILMLMLQFIQGSLEDMEQVLAECRKVA